MIKDIIIVVLLVVALLLVVWRQSEGARARLESGHHAIVPGQPADSRLLAVVASEDSDERMPPARTGMGAPLHFFTCIAQVIAELSPHLVHTWVCSGTCAPLFPL